MGKKSKVRRKKEEEKNVKKSEEIEGYRGNQDVDAILQFIGGENQSKKSKKSADKNGDKTEDKKNKKNGKKEKNVKKSEEIEGYRGNQDVDAILQFIGGENQ